jgi:hypothetical protein
VRVDTHTAILTFCFATRGAAPLTLVYVFLAPGEGEKWGGKGEKEDERGMRGKLCMVISLNSLYTPKLEVGINISKPLSLQVALKTNCHR